MHIEIALKEFGDNVKSYWSGMIIQDGNVVMEIRSEAFIPGFKAALLENYERCTVRIMKELMKVPDQGVLMRLLHQHKTPQPQ